MEKVLLAGNGITAQILCQYLNRDSRYDVVGLTVEESFLGKGVIDCYPEVGISEASTIFPPETHSIIMAIGYNDLNRTRERMFFQLKALGYQIETYIHPDARVFTDNIIGEGSVILPGAVIEPCVQLGVNTMVWSNVTLAHHCIVGDHCWVATGAVVSGQASVLHNSFLGVNCTVVNDITVEKFNIIGADAMISRDTKPQSVYLSRSAEKFRYLSEDYAKHFGI